MPLTHAELADIQADAMADDVDIDLARMAGWTRAEALTFFESGGATAPHAAPTPSGVSAVDARDIFDDGRLLRLLSERLPPLGTGTPMPGETKGAARRCFVPRPEARVRLFMLYGVADVSMSLEPWIRAAVERCDWLEVRLIDLPGHGFRSQESLAECSRGSAASFDEAALKEQRASLIGQLTSEVQAAAGAAPFALFGFSFGALLAFGICLELAARRAASPLCLCVAGRGAPHCMLLNRATVASIYCGDDEQMLAWQSDGGNFETANIPAHMRPRAAQLFRSGMLLGAAPAGDGVLTSPLPAEGDVRALGGVGAAHFQHAADPPRLCKGCPVIAIGSDADAVWPGELVGRWGDVAAEPEAFVHRTFSGVEHMKLMCHKSTMELVMREVAVAAAARLS